MGLAYKIDLEERTAGERRGPVVHLHGPGLSHAEVWTMHGFNGLRWQNQAGEDLFFAMADWDSNPVPTRSGCPILGPFPNRIRHAEFNWNGKPITLPKNDATKQHSIHGEAPRNPWRIVGVGADVDGARVTGSWRPSVDAPEKLSHWTGDYEFIVTWSLSCKSNLTILKWEYAFENLSEETMPFATGLHPYFRLPDMPSGLVNELVMEVPISDHVVCVDNLPTGEHREPPAALDFRKPKAIGETHIDDLFDLKSFNRRPFGFHGSLSLPSRPGKLSIVASREFGQSVLFTPVHRQGVCIEPYSARTDAVHASDPKEAGLIVLQPKEIQSGFIEFRWQS